MFGKFIMKITEVSCFSDQNSAHFLEEFGSYLYFLFLKDFKFHAVVEPTEFFKKLGANSDRNQQF